MEVSLRLRVKHVVFWMVVVFAAVFLWRVAQTGSQSYLPTARYGAAYAAVNNTIYVFGGANAAGFVAEVEKYDPERRQWTAKTAMPQAAAALVASLVGDVVYLIGGYTEQGVSGAIWIYDIASDAWRQVADSIPERWDHMGAVVEDKIYIIGGIQGTGSNRSIRSDVIAFDPANQQIEVRSPIPDAVHGAAVAVLDGRIYVLGGRRVVAEAFGGASASVQVYDPSLDVWTQDAPLLTPRTAARAVVRGNRIYVLSGAAANDMLDSIEVLDPATRSWKAAGTLGMARTAPAAASVGGRTYVIGGYDGMSFLSSVEELDLN